MLKNIIDRILNVYFFKLIFLVRKSHTIKNKLLDVKKALPKNEMDRMNNMGRGGGREMGMGSRGFGNRGDRGNSGASW